jgi:hypothetical protein
MHLAFSEPEPFLAGSAECRMASIPSNRPPPICHDTANMVGTFFTRALKEETGLDYRSQGRALLIGQGAIHVQVPSADVAQALSSSGMVLRIMPTKTEWSRWSDMGSQYQFRDYDMGLAQFPTLAQRRAGDGGAHRRGKPSVSPSRVEIWAGAVSACTGLGRKRTPSRGGGDVKHSAKEASDSRMVPEVPPGHLHTERGEAKQRNPRRKHSKPFYTMPARRQWAPGSGPFAHPRHHPRGNGSGGAWRGAQRWHPRRKPVWTGADEDVRRHFHAGRTPGPQWGRSKSRAARR